MPAVIEIKDLTKTYDNITAVNKLNLEIGESEIFGFLGPNGAGKTTTILMLLGLTEPTSGTVSICGFNATREPLQVKRITGYVPEKVGFYEDLTVHYNLLYTAWLNNIPEQQIEDRIKTALKTVGLPNAVNRKVQQLSHGMKQRLAIADVLVKNPRVVILDEPTSGIDPEGVVQLLELIRKIAQEQGMTVILSSHQLPQVQRICTRVGILSKGKMIAEGPLDQLGRKAFGGSEFRVEVQVSEVTSIIIDAIRSISGVTSTEALGKDIIVNCERDLRPQIAKAVIDNNGQLIQMKIQSYSLEDIYLKYSGEV